VDLERVRAVRLGRVQLHFPLLLGPPILLLYYLSLLGILDPSSLDGLQVGFNLIVGIIVRVGVAIVGGIFLILFFLIGVFGLVRVTHFYVLLFIFIFIIRIFLKFE
jgi:hypothetical protein